ncbi:hypothetical protein EVAR_93006_1 [Eumeta japonica]|uniref:Uncharacterized protein n=1 Tax=Eumeta variegata TaxID=151549 RepID=A0A4C1TBM9_EUMVA|nr:hypothetical protein EVAR_93006_1 [Eumeta japonica]
MTSDSGRSSADEDESTRKKDAYGALKWLTADNLKIDQERRALTGHDQKQRNSSHRHVSNGSSRASSGGVRGGRSSGRARGGARGGARALRDLFRNTLEKGYAVTRVRCRLRPCPWPCELLIDNRRPARAWRPAPSRRPRWVKFLYCVNVITRRNVDSSPARLALVVGTLKLINGNKAAVASPSEIKDSGFGLYRTACPDSASIDLDTSKVNIRVPSYGEC